MSRTRAPQYRITKEGRPAGRPSSGKAPVLLLGLADHLAEMMVAIMLVVRVTRLRRPEADLAMMPVPVPEVGADRPATGVDDVLNDRRFVHQAFIDRRAIPL